jgi:phytoene dehydrogenase-like protein
MKKSVIIIGAGMGGLAAGVYGQLNDFSTTIFEMHSLPGGQCASWQRKGYTFDACIHHLMGCSPETKINALWRELGAMPRDLAYINECTAVLSPEGKMFIDYYDREILREHLKELSPADNTMINNYIDAMKPFADRDVWGELMLGGPADLVKAIPNMLKIFKWFKPTMADYGNKFSDPFLRRAFPLLVYSMKEAPFVVHLARHGYGIARDIAWPIGASVAFSRSIAEHYESLGGKVHYRSRVEKILTRNGRAVGIRLADGSEEFADYVISNADGRKTLLELLEGRFLTEQLRDYCQPPQDETNWAVHVFLGVNRDLSTEPSSLILLLPETVTIAGHNLNSLEMQFYGFDPSMAPPGKGVIKVELVSKHSYWKELAKNRSLYEEEKALVASQVIGILENYLPGLKSQVETVDVPTLLTWERFMGGTNGFNNMPSKKPDIIGSMFKNSGMNIPGLENFYFAGAWATSAGALFINAHSGKKAIKNICKKEGRKFTSTVIGSSVHL